MTSRSRRWNTLHAEIRTRAGSGDLLSNALPVGRRRRTIKSPRSHRIINAEYLRVNIHTPLTAPLPVSYSMRSPESEIIRVVSVDPQSQFGIGFRLNGKYTQKVTFIDLRLIVIMPLNKNRSLDSAFICICMCTSERARAHTHTHTHIYIYICVCGTGS